MRKHAHAQKTKGEGTTGEEILPMKYGSKKIKANIYTCVCVCNQITTYSWFRY